MNCSLFLFYDELIIRSARIFPFSIFYSDFFHFLRGCNTCSDLCIASETVEFIIVSISGFVIINFLCSTCMIV